MHSLLCLFCCSHHELEWILFQNGQRNKSKRKTTNPRIQRNILFWDSKKITHTSYATLPLSPRSRILFLSYLSQCVKRIPWMYLATRPTRFLGPEWMTKKKGKNQIILARSQRTEIVVYVPNRTSHAKANRSITNSYVRISISTNFWSNLHIFYVAIDETTPSCANTKKMVINRVFDSNSIITIIMNKTLGKNSNASINRIERVFVLWPRNRCWNIEFVTRTAISYDRREPLWRPTVKSLLIDSPL